MNTILCALNDMRLFTIELMHEIAYRMRRATWRDVWAWLTFGSGMRLPVAIGLTLYFLHFLYRIFML